MVAHYDRAHDDHHGADAHFHGPGHHDDHQAQGPQASLNGPSARLLAAGATRSIHVGDESNIPGRSRRLTPSGALDVGEPDPRVEGLVPGGGGLPCEAAGHPGAGGAQALP